MKEFLNSLFLTEKGKQIYNNAIDAIADFGMSTKLKDGVLVGFSGGADSVMLLLFLLKYRESFDFNIKAVHVNHGIRGEEALRDERFSREFCADLGVDFEAFEIDIPKIAEEKKLGLEEAARNERYRIFNSVIQNDLSVSAVAVAHNATDNLETIIFNLMRGSGASGAAGINPMRDNVVRPLIYSPKELIVSALNEAKIPFVVDSTNASVDYSRNYIRNEILPRLKRISDSPENMATRFSKNIREDSNYLNSLAEKFVDENGKCGEFSKESVIGLEKPIFSRVLMIMCKNAGVPSPEKVHVDSIFELCRGQDFSFSLPGGISFVSFEGKIYLGEPHREKREFRYHLKEGFNSFSDFGSAIVISKDKKLDCYSNIYKIAIQEKIKFDIINSGLYIRSKKDGDSYKYGKMTRKLKKLFCDNKIPVSKRDDIPIFCDSEGILWVPGLRVRDDLPNGEYWYVTVLEPHIREKGKRYFHQFTKNRNLKGMEILNEEEF